jgi:hypothetical protein
LNTKTINFFVPGLWSLLKHSANEGFERTPFLQRMLHRLDSCRSCGEETENVLLGMFDYMPEASDIPLAVVERQAEDRNTDGYWMRLDPVNFEDDKNFLMLSYPSALEDLTLQEAEELGAAINEHFSEDGWHLEIAGPGRWHLRLDEDPSIQTTPPWHVVGRDILQHLPAGKNSSRWRTWLTEIQMLLHAHPVNAKRIAEGQKPVNGVWAWGGGYLPAIGQSSSAVLVGQNAFLSGLALLTKQEYLCQDVFARINAEEQILFVDYARQALLSGSLENALQAVELLDKNIFEPLSKELKSGHIRKLNIIDCPGYVVKISASGLRKWWRRRKLDL